MRKLFRTLGVVVTLGLVSFATVDALASSYESCYYTCSDGQMYHTYATYYDCCRNFINALWCPPGHIAEPDLWGGFSVPLEHCMYN